MAEDIFQGASDTEVKQRKRYQALLFLSGARMRVRIARRRIGITKLTDKETKTLNLLLAETQDILTQIRPSR